jgi:hypothetical protein
MSTGKHAFKLTSVNRLIESALAKKLKIKAVTMRDGEPYVEIDNAPGTAKNADASKPTGEGEWDNIG